MVFSSVREMTPGDCLMGKYRLDHELGRGGMGVVYRATHLELERPVAIKIVRPELRENPRILKRLTQEARAAAQITSEHGIRVLDVGSTESGAPWIAMEYVEGEDLAHLLQRRGSLPYATAVKLVLQACVAIAEAHGKGIVHRDLKPENLILATHSDGGELVKVADFGVSKQLGRTTVSALTGADSTVGSPHYMAPEQMHSPRDVDARADIWSLGAILYELLSGHRPFDGESLARVCVTVLNHDPMDLAERTRELPIELCRVVMRCLERERARRFGSVYELARALAPFAPLDAQGSLDSIFHLCTAISRRSAQARVPSHIKATSSMAHSRISSRRRASRVLPIAGISLLGLGLFFGQRVMERRREPEVVIAATRAASAVPSAPMPAHIPAPHVTPVITTTFAAPEAAPKPLVAPAVVAPVPRIGPARGAPRRVARTDVRSELAPPREAPPLRAWDPDSFGGRR
jgi:serine/threonine-protein kinase